MKSSLVFVEVKNQTIQTTVSFKNKSLIDKGLVESRLKNN